MRARHRDGGRLVLEIGGAAGRKYRPFLRKNLIAAHSILRPALKQLSVALVGEVTMSRLHRRFLGVAGPTDVLSFELDQRGRRPISGEIVICVPVAQRSSARRKIPIRLELLLYALHGMLHLCGHDDTTAYRSGAMHRLEDLLLGRLGHPPVFAGSAAAGRRHGRRPKGVSR